MRTLPRRPAFFIFSVAALAAGLSLGYWGWPQPGRTFEFGGLVLAAILISVLATPSTIVHRAAMAPSFVIVFTVLLLFGPYAASLVALSGVVAQALASAPGAH